MHVPAPQSRQEPRCRVCVGQNACGFAHHIGALCDRAATDHDDEPRTVVARRQNEPLCAASHVLVGHIGRLVCVHQRRSHRAGGPGCGRRASPQPCPSSGACSRSHLDDREPESSAAPRSRRYSTGSSS